jgi:hypothetical protein
VGQKEVSTMTNRTIKTNAPTRGFWDWLLGGGGGSRG